MRPQPSTSEELIPRLAERDARALAALYDLEAPRLLALGREILSHPQEAASVVEKVFLELLDAAPKLARHGASVEAWLTLATRAAALGRRRSSEASATPPLRAPGRGSTESLPSAQAIRLLDERAELLKKVMRQLPEHQVKVLSLAVFEGCSEQEIGSRLGEPLGQVCTELRAALRFLRHRLRAVLGEWTANI